jgi:hypothetical protein
LQICLSANSTFFDQILCLAAARKIFFFQISRKKCFLSLFSHPFLNLFLLLVVWSIRPWHITTLRKYHDQFLTHFSM